MGRVYKRTSKNGHVWYIDFTASGHRIRRHTKASTKTEALKLLRAAEVDAESSDYKLPRRRKAVLLHTLCDEFLKSPLQMSIHYSSSVIHFLRPLQNAPFRSLLLSGQSRRLAGIHGSCAHALTCLAQLSLYNSGFSAGSLYILN